MLLVGTVAQPLDQLVLAGVTPREIDFISTFVYTPEEVEMYLDMLRQGKIRFPGMVTDVIRLEEVVEKGLARADRSDQIKILIDPAKL